MNENENENEGSNEQSITFGEFKAWMNGLVCGKGNNLPDFNDWELIKQKMECVVPDKAEIHEPFTWPTTPTPPVAPYIPPVIVPYTSPNTIPNKWDITCSNIDSSNIDGSKLTVGCFSGDYGSNFSGYGLPYGSSVVGSDYGMPNESILSQNSIMACPQVAIGNTEESKTPALDKARVLLKQFKDESGTVNPLDDYKFDSSGYFIRNAVGDDLKNIAKITGVDE